MKVIVDELPESPDDCVFAYQINSTNWHSCGVQFDCLNSRCYLTWGEKCPYLKKETDDEVPLIFSGPELSDMNLDAYKALDKELKKLKNYYEMKGEDYA